MAKCTHCGEKLTQKSKYCPHCGERAGAAQTEPAPKRKKRKGLIIGLICGEIALLLVVSMVLVKYMTAARPDSAIDASALSRAAGDGAAPAGAFAYNGYRFGESDAGDINAAKEMLANPVAHYPPQSIHVQWGSWMTQTNGNYTDLGGAVRIGEGRIRDFVPSLDGEALCYLAYTQPGSAMWEGSGVPDGELPSLFWGQSGGAQTEVAQNVIDFTFLPHNRALVYSRSEDNQVLLCTFFEGQEKVLAQGDIGEFCLSANGRYVLYLQDQSVLYAASLTGEEPVRAQNSGAERPCAISNDGRYIWYFRAAEHPVLVCQTLDGKESIDVYETQAEMGSASAELYFNYSATEVIILNTRLDENSGWVSSLFVYRPSAGLIACSDTSSAVVPPQGTQLSYSFGKGIHQLLAEDFSTFFYVAELADYETAEDDYDLHYGLYLYTENGSQTVVEHFAIGQGGDGPQSKYYPFISQDGTAAIVKEDNTLFRIPIDKGNVGAPQVIDVPVWSWQASMDGNMIYYCTGEDTEGYGWPITSTLYYWHNGQTPTMVADDVETSSLVISADGSKCTYSSFNQMFYCEPGKIPSTILTFEEDALAYSIALSNDGGLLYRGLVSRNGAEPQGMLYGIYYYKEGQSTLLIDKDGYEL